MKKIKEKYPVWLSIFVLVLFWCVDLVVGVVWSFVPQNLFTDVVAELVLMLIPFAFVVLFSDISVYKDKGMAETLAAGAYILTAQVALLWANIQMSILDSETEWVSPLMIVVGIISIFGIGFREESLFRGIIVRNIGRKYIKSRKGIFFTVIMSGVLFGGIHLTNIFMGVDAFSAVIQSIVAMGAGFYLGAVYLRGGSLWALILLHTLTDSASLFYSVFTTNNGTVIDTINDIGLINLTPFFVMSAIALFLLRKSKCDEILARFTEEKEEASL